MQRIQGDAERQEYKVFKLAGVFYVPHYRNPHVFVSPGYPRYTSRTYDRDELLAAGAAEQTMSLFTRSTIAGSNWE